MPNRSSSDFIMLSVHGKADSVADCNRSLQNAALRHGAPPPGCPARPPRNGSVRQTTAAGVRNPHRRSVRNLPRSGSGACGRPRGHAYGGGYGSETSLQSPFFPSPADGLQNATPVRPARRKPGLEPPTLGAPPFAAARGSPTAALQRAQKKAGRSRPSGGFGFPTLRLLRRGPALRRRFPRNGIRIRGGSG